MTLGFDTLGEPRKELPALSVRDRIIRSLTLHDGALLAQGDRHFDGFGSDPTPEV